MKEMIIIVGGSPIMSPASTLESIREAEAAEAQVAEVLVLKVVMSQVTEEGTVIARRALSITNITTSIIINPVRRRNIRKGINVHLLILHHPLNLDLFQSHLHV